MHSKKFLKFIFILIIFFLGLTTANAVDFTLKIGNPQEKSFLTQSEVCIPIRAEKIYRCDFLQPFKLKIYYDHTIFEFRKFACNFPLSGNEFKTSENDSSLTILPNFQKIVNLPFKNREFLLGNIVLCVKSNAPSGKHLINCTFTQDKFNHKKIKSDAEINILPSSYKSNSNSAEVKSQNNTDCKLKNITSNIGTLSPSFDPNIFEYGIDVGEDVQYLELNAEPQENDSTVKVSRSKLLAAGKTTTIKITVSSKKGKTIYVVKVNRAAKSNSKNGFKTGIKKNSEKSSNKKHKKSKNKNGLDQNDDIEEDDDENEEENESNSENQLINDESNSKIYLIIILGTIILIGIGYYTYKFIKYKRKNSKNIKNSLNKPLK